MASRRVPGEIGLPENTRFVGYALMRSEIACELNEALEDIEEDYSEYFIPTDPRLTDKLCQWYMKQTDRAWSDEGGLDHRFNKVHNIKLKMVEKCQKVPISTELRLYIDAEIGRLKND